jgi:DNA-binding response OmpR family regulator
MDGSRCILLADDNVTLCFAMREYFVLYDYRVDCAHDIESAATHLNSRYYSVLIADLDLGGTHNLDGFKVIKMALEKCPNMRIVVLTAYGSTEIEATARDLGVSVFLQKPRPLSEVARIVFDLVAGRSKD